MALTPGSRLGAYEIAALIGAGGMGEVYRAHDLKLNRDVALKVLPESLIHDPDRLARFKREAQVLASLNHPHVATIHGLDEVDHCHFLVLELVDGDDLLQVIARGPMQLHEAVPVAAQIAEALEAAHEQGIVHRDLKPANIKVRRDGFVKVLDFGLAKALDQSTTSVSAVRAGEMATVSPTLATPAMTQLGVILGTAAYMSPEQAKGRPADKRSDIWAFGAVLFEMLSGQRAFKGQDVSDTLASVLRQDVDWSVLPGGTPTALRQLMARCLDRDQKRRLRDIGEARIVLSNPAAVSSPLDEPAAASPAAPAMRSLWRRAMPLVLIAIASAAAAWTAARMLRPSTPLAATRFTMLLPEGQSFASVGRHMLAVSDDGSQLVYTALPGRLYRREMSEFDPKPIQGLEGLQNLTSPVFSPDGRSVAFFAAGDRTLKKIAISGGTPVTLCQADNPFGMSWQGDAILFGQGRKGIMRVSSNGGTSEVLVKPNDGEIMQSPQLLPGDQSILFTLATGQERPNLWDSATIVVQSLATGERHTLIQGGSDARYIPTGHLLYAIRGTVFGVSFDPRRLAVRGGPVPLIAGVRRTSGGAGGLPTGAANYAVSRTGSLSYIPGPTYSSVDQFDMIVAEGASVTRLKLPPTSYSAPRVSPDGRRVTFGIDDGNEASVWVYDLSETTTMRRVTFGAHDRVPIWSADGKRVVFQSDREGDRGIFVTPADGGGVVERLTTAEKQATHVPESWSPHGDVLLYSVVSGDEHTLRTLSVRTRQSNPVKGVRSSTPIGAVFSPDGRWIAYTATEIPRSTVYVEPFPPTGERYQLFTRAGDQPHHPVWSPDGKTLFYTPGPGGFEFVTVTTQPSFAFGKPTTVPRTFSTGAPGVRRLWDVMPNGKFIGLIPSGQTESGSAIAQSIHVVLNWTQELKGRVPSGQ